MDSQKQIFDLIQKEIDKALRLTEELRAMLKEMNNENIRNDNQ